MVCTHGGADHIRLGMWRDVSPSVKPFGLATSLVRGRLFSLAPLCKGGCQPFRLTEGLFLRLADTDNPSGASRHLPLHKGGFTGNYCQLEAAPRHLPFQGKKIRTGDYFAS